MKRLAVVLLFSLLISGCQTLSGFVATISPTPTILPPSTPLPPPPTPTLLPPQPTLTSAKPLLLVSHSLQDSNENPQYTLTVDYPQFDGATTSQLQAFNQFSEQKARDLLNTYQTQLASPPATPDPNFYPSFMEATYQVTNGTDGLLSVLYTVADYWSGAAHPNQYAHVLNYNLIAGQEIVLADLFLPGTNYLQVISDYCVTDLNKRDRLMFEAGAQPTTDNYQNWNITPQGLLISFDPYQVGPYAMGPSTVSIPYGYLKDFLNPAGPLAPLIP